MAKKGKYPVNKYYGIPVEDNGSGGFQFKSDSSGDIKIHTWRTGKHTRGKYQRPGQLLLTENNLMVAIIAAEPMAFKNRHSETPCARMLTAFITDKQLELGKQVLSKTATGGN